METHAVRDVGLALLAVAIWPAVMLAAAPEIGTLPGMPPVVDPNDIYSETRAGKLSPAVKGFPRVGLCPQ